MDKDIQVQKCKDLESKLLNLYRKKYLVELKVQERENEVNKVRKSAQHEMRDKQLAGQKRLEQNLTRADMALKKA